MLEVFKQMFKRKPKEKLNCLGVYNIKPYHYFESNFTYAEDVLIEQKDGVRIYGRIFKETAFVFVLVDDEKDYHAEEVTLESLKHKIEEKLDQPFKNSVRLIIFKNNNDATVAIAKQPVINTKTDFYQVFIYNASRVRLEYYRPVPTFYKLYNAYAEAIYMDIAAVDTNL